MKWWLAAILVYCFQLGFSQETEQINTVFKQYQEAVIHKNGNKAFQLVNKQTINFYKEVWKASNSADSATVCSYSFEEKLWILTTRHLISKQEATRLNEQFLFEYLMRNGWIHKEDISQLTIGETDIQENYAIAQMQLNSEDIPYFFQFEKENGKWKVNLIEMLEAAGRNVEAVIQAGSLSENSFIIESIEKISGKKANRAIWLPFKS